MSKAEQRLPGVTLSSFQSVVTDLCGAPVVTDVRVAGPMPGGMFVRFRAQGFSMYPAIRDGEMITVGPVAADRVVRGDVLLYRHSTRVLAHRVVAVTEYGSRRMLQLRGDAKGACDAPVPVNDVIGRVLSVSRHGRTIPLCGLAARLQHRARTAASRAKAFVTSAAALGRSRAIERLGMGRGSSASMFAKSGSSHGRRR